MHDGELTLDDALARTLVADSFPELGDRAVHRMRTAGTVNAIFRVGDTWAARFPLTATSSAELERESQAMAEFALVCPVPAPRPHGVGRRHDDYPSAWTVQSWIPGDTAGFDALAASRSMAEDVGALILALRAVDTRGRVFDGQGRGGNLRDHDEWVAECLRKSAHLLDVERARRLWEGLRDLPSAGPDVMSHRDLTPFNLLVAEHDGHARLRGVLDGGSFGPADRALDLVAAWHLFDAPARAVVRERVGASRVEWLRGAAWAFQQAMGLVWYYEQSNRPMSALGRSTLRRLLDDRHLAASV